VPGAVTGSARGGWLACLAGALGCAPIRTPPTGQPVDSGGDACGLPAHSVTWTDPSGTTDDLTGAVGTVDDPGAHDQVLELSSSGTLSLGPGDYTVQLRVASDGAEVVIAGCGSEHTRLHVAHGILEPRHAILVDSGVGSVTLEGLALVGDGVPAWSPVHVEDSRLVTDDVVVSRWALAASVLQSQARLTHTWFVDNTADTTFVAASARVEMTGGGFVDNTALYSILNATGDLSLSGVSVQDNASTTNALVSLSTGTLTVEDTVFASNDSWPQTLFMHLGTGSVTDGTFTDNTAGQAVLGVDEATLTCVRTTVSGSEPHAHAGDPAIDCPRDGG